VTPVDGSHPSRSEYERAIALDDVADEVIARVDFWAWVAQLDDRALEGVRYAWWRSAGLSDGEIGERCGVHRQTVRRRVRAAIRATVPA
jgi:DNA-directed RNA polymerase specialized sigma24 family protein